MRVETEINGITITTELTREQEAALMRGEVVSIDFFPDSIRSFTPEDMGFTSPRRVHVDSANHPHPAVDAKRIADCINGGFHCKGTAADLNYGSEFDPVDKPSHYAAGRKYEPIDVIEDWGLGMHLGNATKYISRAGRKGEELEDLKKARWYIDRRISMLEEGEDEDD